MVKSKPWLLRCLWLLPVLLLFIAIWRAQPAPSIRLMHAIEADNPEAIRRAYKKGADPDRVFIEQEPQRDAFFDRQTGENLGYKTPLTYAIERQRWEAMRELLRLGANPNICDRNHQYPTVLLAASNHNQSDWRFMFHRGANINVSAGKAVFVIAESCSVPLLKLILKHGANVRQRDPNGYGVMAYVDSSWPDAHDVRELLREHGARVEQRPKSIPPPGGPGSTVMSADLPENEPNEPRAPRLSFSQLENGP